jgi:ABC-type amino acid transport system permease subunit
MRSRKRLSGRSKPSPFAALIYFIVITAFSLFARRLERRLAVSGESTVH